jgi:hypothetical protein
VHLFAGFGQCISVFDYHQRGVLHAAPGATPARLQTNGVGQGLQWR